MDSRLILGISAYYHDSAAVLLRDGEIVAAAQEERFTRVKHDPSFPQNAVKYVLSEGGVSLSDLHAVAFYDKPMLKFERLLETQLAFAPRSFPSFLKAMPVWTKEKLFTKQMLYRELRDVAGERSIKLPPLFFAEHHLSHAASAFFPSPFESAAILTIDGVGEWTTTALGLGEGRSITILKELHFPHSLGLFYSAFTAYCGFAVNSDEYKLMGLASYGDPNGGACKRYESLVYENMVDLRPDGSFLLNLDLFAFPTRMQMCDNSRWKELFGIPPRMPGAPISQAYADLALAAQRVTEKIVLRLAKTAKKITSSKRLVLAGGVALNCVANGRIKKSGLFDDIWIQPAAGDAGGALGAAYAVHCIKDGRRLPPVSGGTDRMKGALLGPAFGAEDIIRMAERHRAAYAKFESFGALCEKAAMLISNGHVIGWFQGRMEWGPRALGNRSIVADPRDPSMQRKLNMKIKFRESFRPFAPAVMEEDAKEWFDINEPSPYMLTTAQVLPQRLTKTLPPHEKKMDLSERLSIPRSEIPAVTHVDLSARVQTVSKESNERFYALLSAFKKLTGCPVLINTSFNVHGEPIVCTPDEAYDCFLKTKIDFLVIENFLFYKKENRQII